MMKITKKKHRGVSEVISTVLILAITMVGAVFVATIVQNSMLTTTDQTSVHSEFVANSIKLTAYDTRDSADLSGISNLDNEFSQYLCTNSCSGFANNVPIGGNPGTDFIVLQIQNTNLNPIYLSKIYINGIEHEWASGLDDTPDTLNASFDDPTGANYPHAGKFRIIPVSNNDPILQRVTNDIQGGEEVRIVIKLSQNFVDDIEMWRPLQIHLIHGGAQPTEYIILSGDTR